ncbi:MAG: Flp pilus assembly complex ATPase component TadA [Taibaiella sp.]|nr:Flp pilus assembly complex ATPase component TadA [Taibaiella sp.]
MDYFKRLLELLKLERDEDKRAWLELMQSSSVAERRANGVAWYPVAIRGSELSKAEYITVELERTTHTDIAHQLRFGASAMLFSNHDRQNDHIEGTITHSSGNRLKISFRTDELPDWADNGKLGVDLLFDDTSYDEMEAALKKAQAYADTRERDKQRLIGVLTGTKEPSFNEDEQVGYNARLNEIQNEAVRKIVQAQDVAIVHGPPGTGKTTTLVQAILELVKRGDDRVLVTAPSNAAVDLLSERLAAAGLNVLRVGNPARVSEELTALTLDSRMSAHATTKEIKRLKKQASEFRDMAHKYKRNFGKSEREQRKALFDEANKIMKEVGRMEQYITGDIVSKAQVVTATLVGANHYTVRDLEYKTVVIDEAGQALEPACWIPILKGKRVILAGDHCQLPPTIKSDAAARGGLSETLMEKCVRLHPQAVVLLQQQYRMHERIMGYSSRVFYNDKLQAHESVASHLVHSEDVPMLFIDTAGCGFEEKNEQTSISNPEEAAFLIKHLSASVQALARHYAPEQFPSVGVISPYREQLFVLKELLEHAPELQPYRHRITVNTIDSFQGQERDIVYLSMVRSNSDNVVGFLADTRRMNVAMTRARKKLVIIGDSATLSANDFYANLITYAEEHGAYRSAWEEGYA